jgi:hypothetical protein
MVGANSFAADMEDGIKDLKKIIASLTMVVFTAPSSAHTTE